MHDMEIVPAMRALLAEKIGSERFELWFASTQLTLADQKLTVEVPSKFNEDWLRRNYRGTLEMVAQAVSGQTLPVEFRVNPLLAGSQRRRTAERSANCPQSAQRNNPEDGDSDLPLPPYDQNLLDQTDHGVPAFTQPTLTPNNALANGRPSSTARRLTTTANGSNTVAPLPRRRFSTLESFIIGPCNRLAHASAQTTAERLGMVTPLFVHGPHGCGKTHLLEAVWSAVRKQNRATNAVYLSAEQFTTLFLSALHGHGMPNFRRKYRGVELLLIDDLQFFSGKKATRIELLHTIDALSREGRQLVFSADRPPAELTELGPELTTRLSGGMVCAIEPPDAQTRLGLVRSFANRLDFELPEDVVELIATKVTAGARELCGAVNRLHAAASLLGSRIDRPFAAETLAEMLHGNGKLVRLHDIEHAVCDVFGLGNESLQSARRSQHICAPRMLAMFLARKYTRAGLNEIGQHFGGRSHSTVISAHKRVADWIARQSEIELAGQHCKIEEAVRRVEAKLRIG